MLSLRAERRAHLLADIERALIFDARVATVRIERLEHEAIRIEVVALRLRVRDPEAVVEPPIEQRGIEPGVADELARLRILARVAEREIRRREAVDTRLAIRVPAAQID